MVATQAKQEEKVELTTVTPEMALNWINENRETANRHLNNTVVVNGSYRSTTRADGFSPV